jgi:hypothetical protein
MRQQPAARIGFGRVLPCIEDQVLSSGVRMCANLSGRSRRRRICMHPYIAEIVSEARLEKRTGSGIQPLARRAQDSVNCLLRGCTA